MRRSLLVAVGLATAGALAMAWLRWPSPEPARAAERPAKSADDSALLAPALSQRTVLPPELAPGSAASAPADSVARDTVRVRTVDLQGAVVREVELFETTDRGSRRVGSSGPDGEVELEFERRAWTALVGRRAAFGPARVSWRDQAPATVELRLPGSGTLTGRVVFADGQGAPDGLRVLAVPTRLNTATLGRTAAELVANPEFAWTLTQSDGAFQLSGLAAEETYALHAGGRGFLVRDQPPYARTGDSGIQVTVARGYGVIFEFVDATGTAPCVPEVYGALGSFNMTIHDPGAEFALNLPPSARLALETLGNFEASPTRQLVLLTSPLDLAELGPIRVSCALPGYSPVEQECFALPIESDLARWTQPLIRTTSDFGELRLKAPALENALRRSSGRMGPVATLELAALGQGRSVRVLRADAAAPGWFECVPFGQHELVFVSQPETEHSRLPLGMVRIGPDPVQLDLPTAQMGALLITAKLDDGREYVGELAIGLGSVTAASTPAGAPVVGSITRFRHPPYEFALLPQGLYRAWISEPGKGSATSDVRVEGGSTSFVELRMRL